MRDRRLWYSCRFEIWLAHRQQCFRDACQILKQLSLQWCHNGRNSVSNHQLHGCLTNRLFRRRSKKSSKAPRHWPLCGEFTGDRWIPRTNGQLRGKCFHLMTSSCYPLTSCLRYFDNTSYAILNQPLVFLVRAYRQLVGRSVDWTAQLDVFSTVKSGRSESTHSIIYHQRLRLTVIEVSSQ